MIPSVSPRALQKFAYFWTLNVRKKKECDSEEEGFNDLCKSSVSQSGLRENQSAMKLLKWPSWRFPFPPPVVQCINLKTLDQNFQFKEVSRVGKHKVLHDTPNKETLLPFCQTTVCEFVTSSRRGQQNGFCDHLHPPKQRKYSLIVLVLEPIT